MPFALLFLLTTVCHAQDLPVVFKRVSLGNANFALITGITQDSKGYMWLASLTGPDRYDGYHHTRYTNDPLNPNSLADNFIECICADKKGMIWVGTKNKGVDRLNPESRVADWFYYTGSRSNRQKHWL